MVLLSISSSKFCFLEDILNIWLTLKKKSLLRFFIEFLPKLIVSLLFTTVLFELLSSLKLVLVKSLVSPIDDKIT